MYVHEVIKIIQTGERETYFKCEKTVITLMISEEEYYTKILWPAHWFTTEK